MSKIWLLLLLVGAFGLAQSFPTLEDDEYEWDVLDEARGFGDWVSDQWTDFKSKFKKVKKAIVETFNKGRAYLKKKAVQVDPMECDGKMCKSCISFLEKKNKYCTQFVFSRVEKVTFMKITVTKEKPHKGTKDLFGPVDVSLGNIPTCMNLGKFAGKLCLQGVEGKITSIESDPNVNFCLGVVLKNTGIGCKFCVTHEGGKLKMRLKPKLFAGDEAEETILEAGVVEDEGKELDAEED